MIKRMLGGLAVAALLCTPLMAEAKTFKNTLPRKDWAKYGVNPWRLDTDNDGYSDASEVKNGFCPTSQDSISIDDSQCQKGSIDFNKQIYTPPASLADLSAREVQTFSSCSQLRGTLANAYTSMYAYDYTKEVLPPSSQINESTSNNLSPLSAGLATGMQTSLPDYSSTNVQVEGVDEGDMIETDGKYIYTLSGKTIYVTKATPAESAEVVSEIDIPDMYSSALYLDGAYLTVVGMRYGLSPEENLSTYYNSFTNLQIWSVKDPVHPTLVRSLDFGGNLISSRVTNGYWYGALNSYVLGYASKPQTDPVNELVPVYRDQTGNAIGNVGGFKQLAGCTAISYLPNPRDYTYTTIVAVPVRGATGKIGSKVVFGSGSNLYMSQKNLYLFTQHGYWNWANSSLTTNWQDRTDIYKFSLDKNNITFKTSQTVPGSVLNQFSADETGGKDEVLRVATTVRNYAGEPSVQNNIYTFDADLNRIGWSEGFGGGEQIYAVRFVGKRAYVVTFKNTDPLFVFDLSNPRSPRKLGELSMPGYSTYLQPYDETHLIGIGKDAVVDDMSGSFAWYQGMKMALFDVTDPNNPTQMFTTSIGDRGTDSYALYDHHALLFSKQKNVLALPVSVAQLTDEQKKATDTPYWSYGTNTYNGLYVYHLDLTHGFQFLGGVSHAKATGQYSYMYSNDSIRRSLYIGDKLYAFSPQEISIHNLNDLRTVKEVMLNSDGPEQNGIIRNLLGL